MKSRDISSCVCLYIFIIVTLFIVQTLEYDLVLIPLGSFNLPERTTQDLKLDIEDYDLPNTTPDIDNVDYTFYDRKRIAKTGDDIQEVDLEELAEDKIVGGNEVEINLYPYHVAYGNNCGGALIDQSWVITAAHCGSKPYVRVGSKYLGQGQKIDVQSNYVHPGWSVRDKAHPFDFDFQLLKLTRRAQMSDNVQPIPLAHISNMVIGAVVTVTGWGNTRENGPYSRVLRAVRVPIISKENCQRVPFPYFRGMLTPRMFCAGYSEGKKDACQGDSGGPAVSDGRLMGMVSFGYGCATPGSYGVYSKVAHVRSWIEETSGLKLK